MKTKFAAIITVVMLSAIAAPSFASDAAAANADTIYRLKDGGNLYVFKDGRMAQENQLGRAVFLNEGETYETVDGQKIVANSNEVARLDGLLKQRHKN